MNTKMGKIKAALARLIADTFANVTTDKGILVYDADELAVDVAVFVEDEEGNRNPAEDGEYKLEDNTIVVVAEGKVKEIVIPEPEVPAEEPETEVVEEVAEDVAEPAAEPVAEPEVENPDGGKEPEDDAIEALRKEVNELYAVIDALTKRVEALEGKPAAEPAAEEFEKVRTINTKNAELSNLNKFFN